MIQKVASSNLVGQPNTFKLHTLRKDGSMKTNETDTTRDAFMEDVHSIALDAMNAIEKRLKDDHKIILTPKQQDLIYIPMSNEIEKICGYPGYRSHN